MQELTLTPEATFIDPLIGRWTNPRLGTIEIRRGKEGVVLAPAVDSTILLGHGRPHDDNQREFWRLIGTYEGEGALSWPPFA